MQRYVNNPKSIIDCLKNTPAILRGGKGASSIGGMAGKPVELIRTQR